MMIEALATGMRVMLPSGNVVILVRRECADLRTQVSTSQAYHSGP